ncbi:hypothetical protein KQI84_10405 [bacterium]|nr:hypothetical protein [bacterium]
MPPKPVGGTGPQQPAAPPPPGYANPIPNALPPAQGNVPPAQYAAGAKPGMVTAIAVLYLVGGIFSTLSALIWAVSSLCIWIPWVLEIVAGIWSLTLGIQMLNNDKLPPNRLVGALLIGAILDCNPVSMTLGILIVVFAGSQDVRNYYQAHGIYY